jgi:CHAT domain-containing protein/Tfp pilus assembly protein PilF
MNITKYQSTIAAIILLLTAFMTFGQTDAPKPLPNQGLEREISGGEKHQYPFTLKANEFFQVRVEQKGIDVAVEVLGANGKALAGMDSPNSQDGPETLSFTTTKAGKFTLQIYPIRKNAEKGIYLLKLESSRQATARDLKRIKTERLFMEAIKLRNTEGQKEIALIKFEKALAGWREQSDQYLIDLTGRVIEITKKAIKADSVLREALILFEQGTQESYQAAAEKFRLATDLYLEYKRNSENAGLSIFYYGIILEIFGEKSEALKLYDEALLIIQRGDDLNLQALLLSRIANAYFTFGQAQKSLEMMNLALSVSRQSADRTFEPSSLLGIGRIYESLNDLQKALDFYRQALTISREIGEKHSETAALNNIGMIYNAVGEIQKALEYYNLALPISRLTKNKLIESTILNNIGSVYLAMGNGQKALEFFNRALQVKNLIGEKGGKALLLNNLGFAAEKLNEPKKAVGYYHQGLQVAKQVGDRAYEALILGNLMYVSNSLKDFGSAVFYGKQSVNLYQELRQNIKGLGAETQNNYLKKIEPVYRQLADLLIAQGSFAQAERILAMLKEEEYFDFVRRDSSEVSKLDERVPLNEKEKALITRYSLLSENITAIGQEFQQLDSKKRKLAEGVSLPPDEQKRYSELEKQLTDANAAFKLFLEKELAAEIGQQKKTEIEIDRNLQDKLRKWGDGTVALYTVAGEDRYRVILTTPTVQIDGKTDIKIADLNKKVFEFRAALQNPSIDPRPLGKELYDILIKPIETRLKQANAKTLIWSLDGTLRYLPLGALSPDGKKYLVEDYQNVIITPQTRDDLTNLDADWKALGLGVSEAQSVKNPDDASQNISFKELPGTESELTAIVKDERATNETGVLTGRRMMNKDFTVTNFKDSLTGETEDGRRKYNLIHIASHFRLGSNWSNSFLLLGNGEILTLEEINNSPNINFGEVELITLSACNTGFADAGNGKEIDSLASVIQTKSGKAVLATLWAVADESTSLLMSEFYRLRKENPKLTKAEAIQLAQQAMIQGKLKSSGNKSRCRDGVEVILEGSQRIEFKCDANAPYSHPYFWSPFVLIGNWR